jgi:hypothetical protein
MSSLKGFISFTPKLVAMMKNKMNRVVTRAKGLLMLPITPAIRTIDGTRIKDTIPFPDRELPRIKAKMPATVA